MTTFDEVMARAALPETVVRLVVGGDLLARIRDLEAALAAASEPTSLADGSAARLREEIDALHEQMRESEIPFRLRALSGRDWARLKSAMPTRKAETTDEEWEAAFFEWVCKLVAQSAADPVMTPEQVAQLCDRLAGSAWERLTDQAWALNEGTLTVPKSSAASAGTASSGATSRRRSGSGSRTQSSAGNPDPAPPATSTTTTDA